MVIDTSAILHILFEEPGWQQSVARLLTQETRVLSAASLVEAQAVIAGRTLGEPRELLDRLLLELHVELAPFTVGQAHLARQAYLEFGKGQGHEAQLNYGDVMAYALAKDREEPLAFVGGDFEHTDLETVRLSAP